MQPRILSCLVAALFAINQGWHCAASWDGGDSVMSFLRHINETRNTEVNPEAKQKAREFIISVFKESGLNAWTEEFPSNNAKYPGINVVGVLPGLHYRSYTDKIFIIGAHYDTVATTPGVDDNGSGIAAMLRAIKRYTMEGGRCHGYNDELQHNSQLAEISCWSTTGFTGFIKFVKENNFRGDGLAVIGRAEDDNHLLRSFGEHFNATAEHKHVGIPLPFRGNSDDLLAQRRALLWDFLRSDHRSFYRDTQKAIFLTDTTNFRGRMIKCYHQACDSMSQVTSEMVGFLSKTADTLTSIAQDLTTNKDCGGLWNTTDEGFLTSKYYPCTYPDNMDCVWTIYKPAKYRGEEYKLALSFKDFLLEDSKNCFADVLEITEIEEGTEGSLTEYKFCGSNITKTFQTTKAGFRVHFHSNGFNTTKRFKASWTIEMPTSKGGGPRGQFLYLAVSILLMFPTTAFATNL